MATIPFRKGMVAIPDGGSGLRCDLGVTVPPEWVLVVADDATERMLLFRLLERDRFHATVSDGAREALELLRAEPFGLVLLDLVKLDPDGYWLLERLKEDRLLRNIPVVVISAVNTSEAIARCLGLGAEDYILKPYELSVLVARIVVNLEKRRQISGQ